MTNFYINKASGPAKLYIRVRHQGNDIKVATDITVDAAKWNKRKEKPSTVAATEQIRRIVDARLLQGPDVSPDEIRHLVQQVYYEQARQWILRAAARPLKMTLNRYIGLYLSEIEEGKRLNYRKKPFSPSSIKSIRYAITVFADYQRFRAVILDFEDIDLNFLGDYSAYLEEERRFKQNTASKCVKELKTIMSVAKFEGYTDNAIFDNPRYGIAREEVDTIALTEEELFRFMMVDVSSMKGKAELARDLFVAGSCSCQRHSDFSKLCIDNLEKIQVDGEEVWMLHFRQQKTGGEVAIPCRPELRAILRKYNYTIPTMTLQVMNRHIKNIAKQAGIDSMVKVSYTKAGKHRTDWVPKWRLVSTHTARRTGATLMYYKGVDVYDIMRITGHRSPEMLRKYIRAEPIDTVRKLHNTPFFRGE